MIRRMCVTALRSSFYIWNARHSLTWNPPSLSNASATPSLQPVCWNPTTVLDTIATTFLPLAPANLLFFAPEPFCSSDPQRKKKQVYFANDNASLLKSPCTSRGFFPDSPPTLMSGDLVTKPSAAVVFLSKISLNMSHMQPTHCDLMPVSQETKSHKFELNCEWTVPSPKAQLCHIC